MTYWVYILSSQKNGTLYIGITNNIARRTFEHKEKQIPGFTKEYNIINLAYAEEYENIHEAIYREKCLKAWKREWKLNLIEKHNPLWKDLFYSVM